MTLIGADHTCGHRHVLGRFSIQGTVCLISSVQTGDGVFELSEFESACFLCTMPAPRPKTSEILSTRSHLSGGHPVAWRIRET